jgi:hypothetical protein
MWWLIVACLCDGQMDSSSAAAVSRMRGWKSLEAENLSDIEGIPNAVLSRVPAVASRPPEGRRPFRKCAAPPWMGVEGVSGASLGKRGGRKTGPGQLKDNATSVVKMINLPCGPGTKAPVFFTRVAIAG